MIRPALGTSTVSGGGFLEGSAPSLPPTLLFPELATERATADRLKRDAEILVILGNPPYDGFAGTLPAFNRPD